MDELNDDEENSIGDENENQMRLNNMEGTFDEEEEDDEGNYEENLNECGVDEVYNETLEVGDNSFDETLEDELEEGETDYNHNYSSNNNNKTALEAAVSIVSSLNNNPTSTRSNNRRKNNTIRKQVPNENELIGQTEEQIDDYNQHSFNEHDEEELDEDDSPPLDMDNLANSDEELEDIEQEQLAHNNALKQEYAQAHQISNMS